MAAGAVGRAPDGRCRVRVGDFELLAGQGDTAATGAVKVVIRPERVRLEPYDGAGSVENRIPGMIERTVYLGSITQLIVRLAPGDTLQAMVPNEDGARPYQQGTPVRAYLPAEALRVLKVDEAD
jgi:ABC-type Fe3+/spermidine/putrescine transport system ATPase subunit